MDFSLLSAQQREQLLLQHGECLGCRVHGSHQVLLYAVNGIYAEVFFNLFNNQVDYIKPVENLKDLDPFLEDINVERFW